MKPTLRQASVVLSFIALLAMLAEVSKPSASSEPADSNVRIGGPRTFASQPVAPGISKVTTDNTNFSGTGRQGDALLLVGGNGNTGQFKPNRNGVQVQTFSGTLLNGEVVAYAGDPNTHVTADIGSMCLDYSTPAIWTNTNGATAWSAVASGSSITTAVNNLAYGWFGTGIDGSPTFDGSTTVLGMVPSSNTYTLLRDLFLDTPICNTGITIAPSGYRIFVKTDFVGPASGTCTVDDHGPDGVGITAGAARADRTFILSGTGTVLGPGYSGGNGQAGFSGGGTCTASVQSPCAPRLAGNGGAGGGNPGVANGGAACTTTCANLQANAGGIDFIDAALRGWAWGGGTPRAFTGGSGGAGGGNDGTGAGNSGAGGAGGGVQVFSAKHVTNPTHVLITSRGGNGSSAGSVTPCSGGHNGGGGGGGGGGVVVLVIGYGTAPTTSVVGGTHGNGCGTLGTNGGDGTAGQLVPFQMN